MTPPQIAMLKRLIEAERSYWMARLNGERYVEDRWRMIEVGRIAGIDKRTARSLENAGLIEGWSDENNQWWVRLKIEDKETGRVLLPAHFVTCTPDDIQRLIDQPLT